MAAQDEFFKKAQQEQQGKFFAGGSGSQWGRDATNLRLASSIVGWIFIVLNAVVIFYGVMSVNVNSPASFAIIIGGILGAAIGSLVKHTGACLASLVEKE